MQYAKITRRSLGTLTMCSTAGRYYSRSTAATAAIGSEPTATAAPNSYYDKQGWESKIDMARPVCRYLSEK